MFSTQPFSFSFIVTFCSLFCVSGTARTDQTQVPLVFSGGHELGNNDYGRPCALMAAALGVKTDEFRQAFSGVHPARGGGPSREDQQKNKQALMKVLAPLGVTNERMDEVANYYRYRRWDGELWKNTPAKGYAVVEDGKVKQIVLTDHGSGYNTPPAVTINGMDKVTFTITLHLDKDMTRNGSIDKVEIAETR